MGAISQTVDGRNVRGPARNPDREEELYRCTEPDQGEPVFTWPERTNVDVESMAGDAFTCIDDIHSDIMNEDGQLFGNVDNILEEDEENEVDMETLLWESAEKVFEGSELNRLQCAIIIFLLCSLYSVLNTILDALLTWVAGDLLPTSNCFPRTLYEVKRILMKWGLKHKQIHCCPDAHVLYEGENENLSSCPICNKPRYILGSSSVPQRVVRYFDIIKHLVRMFRCPEIAKHMTWYSSNKSSSEKMYSVADSE